MEDFQKILNEAYTAEIELNKEARELRSDLARCSFGRNDLSDEEEINLLRRLSKIESKLDEEADRGVGNYDDVAASDEAVADYLLENRSKLTQSDLQPILTLANENENFSERVVEQLSGSVLHRITKDEWNDIEYSASMSGSLRQEAFDFLKQKSETAHETYQSAFENFQGLRAQAPVESAPLVEAVAESPKYSNSPLRDLEWYGNESVEEDRTDVLNAIENIQSLFREIYEPENDEILVYRSHGYIENDSIDRAEMEFTSLNPAMAYSWTASSEDLMTVDMANVDAIVGYSEFFPTHASVPGESAVLLDTTHSSVNNLETVRQEDFNPVYWSLESGEYI